MTPTASVVLITRGPSDALAQTVASLARAQDLDRVEVLIGLNGTGSIEALRQLVARHLPAERVTVVELERAPPGAARNELATLARSPVLLFLDDDVEVPPELLVGVRQAFDAGNAGAVLTAAGGPNLTAPWAPRFEQLAGRVLASPIATGPVRHRYRVEQPRLADDRSLMLCNLAVRRDAFLATGFDRGLSCAEENGLLAQLESAGKRIAYLPGLAVFHRRRRTIRTHLRQMWKYGFGRGQLMVRAPSGSQAVFALPSLLVLAALAALVLLPPPLALGLVAAYLAVLALEAVRLGGREAPIAFALLMGTHVGYATGVASGVATEVLRRLAARTDPARDGPFAADALKTFGAFVLAVAASVAAGIVLARVLGPEGRGLFELGRTLAMTVALPAGLGLGAAAVFLKPRRLVDASELHGAVVATLVTGAVGGAVLAAVLATFGAPNGLGSFEVVIAAASVPMIAFFFQGQAALRGIGAAAWARRTLALRDLGFLVLLVPALALEVSVLAAVIAWTVHWLISALVVAIVLVRRTGRPQSPRRALPRLLAFGGPQALVAVLGLVHLRLDVIVVQAFDGATEVGRYAVAFGAAELLIFGGMAIGQALFPRTAASSTSDPAGGATRTARALRCLLVFELIAAAGLALIAPTLISVAVGSAYAPAVEPLRILLPGAIAMSALLLLQSDLAGRGRVRAVAVCAAVALTVNLALCLLLVPPLGPTGAALASSLSYSLGLGLMLVVFCSTTGVPLRSCLIAHRDDLPAAARALGRRPIPPPTPEPSAT